MSFKVENPNPVSKWWNVFLQIVYSCKYKNHQLGLNRIYTMYLFFKVKAHADLFPFAYTHGNILHISKGSQLYFIPETFCVLLPCRISFHLEHRWVSDKMLRYERLYSRNNNRTNEFFPGTRIFYCFSFISDNGACKLFLWSEP